MEKENKPLEVKIKVQEIEFEKIDLKKYIGKEKKIECVKTMKGEFGYYIQVESTLIDELQRGKDTIELRARRNFTLYEDKEGNIGYGKDSLFSQFMESKRVKTHEQLVGKTIIIQVEKNKNTGKEFLSFI